MGKSLINQAIETVFFTQRSLKQCSKTQNCANLKISKYTKLKT